MPIPNDYTRELLAPKLAAMLEDTATVLGWTNTAYPDGDYDDVIEAIESQLVVAVIDDATDKLLVELQSAVEVWRAVSAQEVTAYGIGGLKEILNRDQVFAHARAMFLQALADLDKYKAGLIIADLGVPSGIPYSITLKVKAVW